MCSSPTGSEYHPPTAPHSRGLTFHRVRRAVDLLHVDRVITEAKNKNKKNQATVTPDHYPPTAAFTNRLKVRCHVEGGGGGETREMAAQSKRGEAGPIASPADSPDPEL